MAHGFFPGGCVVLARPDSDPPTTLLRALEMRGLPARVVNDEPSVMTLFADRPAGRRVLIVVEPGRWRRLAELVCAVQTYHGGVLVWQYAEHAGDRPKLTTLDQRVAGPGSASQLAVTPGQHGGQGMDQQRGHDDGPIGKIVGRRRAIDSLLVRVPGQPLSAREVVTHQELTMLLGPLPGEAG